MAKMSESEIRKKLIQEGFWSWLFGGTKNSKEPEPRKPAVVINWDIIEENMGYEISEKNRERIRMIILGRLYHVLYNDAIRAKTIAAAATVGTSEGTVASAYKKYASKARK